MFLWGGISPCLLNIKSFVQIGRYLQDRGNDYRSEDALEDTTISGNSHKMHCLEYT